ncbi:MAG: quinone-dependent dihydroorotate dehydrogenase [Alphaproteobacteria bacterium]|nr:MAG: quinone-dependent dihydroorotate dehydrogenase [Alphaproteobacteria bacterium]
MSYSFFAQNILFRIDPEQAHELTIAALKLFPIGQMPEHDPALHQKVWNINFLNPIGLAAGFDKNAEIGHKMFRFGFGFVEMGTVTPRPQPGNPRPRIFRLIEDRAVINRMGFNGKGLDFFEMHLRHVHARKPQQAVIGANIGINKESPDPTGDIYQCLRRVYPMADYITVNISSPNTPGLRAWQEGDALVRMIDTAQQTRRDIDPAASKPILFKLAPDLTYDQLEHIAEVAVNKKLDGIIISNTTIDRPRQLESAWHTEQGGLSGRPLFRPSTKALRLFHRFTKGQVPLIGVGGVSNSQDAYRKIKAGASLVQLYTGMIYSGPYVARDINQGLAELLRADGFTSIAQAVGVESDGKFDDNG